MPHGGPLAPRSPLALSHGLAQRQAPSAQRRSASIPFSLRYVQLFQPRDDVLGGCGDLDLAIDMENLPVRSDVERPPSRHVEGAEYAVGRGDLLVGVTQDWVVSLERLRELRVGLEVVDTRSEIRDVELSQF